MPKYKFEITEERKTTVVVEADTYDNAFDEAAFLYDNGDIDMDYADKSSDIQGLNLRKPIT